MEIGQGIQKILGQQQHKKEIVEIITDINNYLKKKSIPKMQQGLIGMKALFRGFIIKEQVLSRIINKKHHQYSKIIIKN